MALKYPRRTAELREALADGRWKSNYELMLACGPRYGAHIFTVRRGEDGLPAWDIEKRCVDREKGVWHYRRRLDSPFAFPPPPPSYASLFGRGP